MAMPPGIGDGIEGDRKRLMQRADTFSIGTGVRDAKDRDDIKDFDEELDTALKPRTVKTAEEDVEKQARETEEYRKDQLLDQAEKRGSSSPSLNPFPGCLTLPGIGVPMMMIGETQRSESKGRSGGVESASETTNHSVSQNVLDALRQAGLPQPVESLDDPRLGKAAEKLLENFTMSLRGSDRVYVWQGEESHQFLTIGMHETKVESAAGTTVETLRRVGDADEKTVSTRPLPEDSDFEMPTDPN